MIVFAISSWSAWEAAFWTILVGVVSNVTCGVLGCFLVLRRMSLLGDAISHAVLPGVALGFLVSGSVSTIPLLIGAVLLALATAFLTQMIHRFGRVAEDASLGVVYTTLFAVGVLMLSGLARKIDLDPGCLLYGMIELSPIYTQSLFGIELPRALITLSIASLVVAAFLTLFWKELKLVAFDPGLATSMGIPAEYLHQALLALVAGVTVASFEAVGSILVVAMLIVPGATALFLAERMGTMLACAAGVGALSAIIGYFWAAAINTSVAGMMAVVAGILFALAVVFAPKRGVASKAWHRLAFSWQIVADDVVAGLYRGEESSEIGAPGMVHAATVARLHDRPFVHWLAIRRLFSRGEIQRDRRRGLELTEKGRERARSLIRAHRLWEAFLGENFELPLDHLHEPAERLEHYLGPGLQQELADALQRPGLDPHGKPIP